MSEHDLQAETDAQKERRLEGNTVEERDRAKEVEVLANLGQYRREQHGLPSEPVIIDGELSQPRPFVEATVGISQIGATADQIPDPISEGLRNQDNRYQLRVASEALVDKSQVKILSHLLRAT